MHLIIQNTYQWAIDMWDINFHTNEYSKKLCYYLFAVKLDRYVGSCNTLNDLYVPSKTEELNLSV